ncbi:MAG TPA: DEAD/DEAH box helicase [Ignavibacteriaceae bacterium]|nr:DEAD/DEAH box helicase [Ignavibacteriaceae bacterium]
MVNIYIYNSELLVEDSLKEIFKWEHRAFFNISLGMEIDEEKKRYFFSEKNLFRDLVREIITYLNEEGIQYSTDKKVNEIILTIKNQQTEFNEAVENSSKILHFEQPKAFVRELKPYQLKGVEHLLKVKHGANFSVPGSGKTTMVYAYYNELRKKNIVEKIFVVGPFSSFAPWEDESVKCFGENLISARLTGSKRQTYYLQSSNFELFLCHYQTASNDKSEIIDLFSRHKFLFVIDESHYIKRFSGGVWSDAILQIASYAKRRIVLSGTPMPNGYIDLWTQMTFLWPNKQLLGERNAYKVRCADSVQQEEIKKEIRPFFFRVKKSDLQLPKPKTIKIEYSLKPIQSKIYQALSVRLITELKLQTEERQKLKQWRKAKMVRLLQAASNPTLLYQYSQEFDIPPLSSDGSSLIELIEKYPKFEIPIKFEAAIKLIEKLTRENKKIVLWTTFIHNIEMLKERLKSIKYFTVFGAIPRDDDENEIFNREKEIRDFKQSEEPCVLIANPAACAESISLHKFCHDAIYLDRTFNCGQYIQSMDRLHRIGLEKDEVVNYYILIAKNTIDETIDRRLNEKFETMISVLEDEIPIGELDVEGPELENENEEIEDFEATVKDVKNFLKAK